MAVHDYQDPAMLMVAAMARPLATCRRLGFTIPDATYPPGPEAF